MEEFLVPLKLVGVLLWTTAAEMVILSFSFVVCSEPPGFTTTPGQPGLGCCCLLAVL